MLSSLYSCFTVKKPYEYAKLKYEAAGCLFTNKTLVLAGYQPNKSVSYITGIGGTKMPGEDFQRTAFREVLEELFHIDKFPDGLLDMIEYIIVPTAIKQNSNYAVIILTFNDLEMILKICRRFSLKSPLYDTFPLNLTDLIFNRRLDTSAEITHLTLVPLDKNIKFDPYFIEDITMIS
jgi:hypothetical protein